tara:strand:+ start:605 stop:1864 length:1260 start_codon:yes stop_codon:yes gene_type:complete
MPPSPPQPETGRVTIDDLSDLIPRFDQRGMDLQLDRMQGALKHLGSPCGDVPAIQIAGTNGKGSIASFISAALHWNGIRSGVTTSPHLVSWCERIAIDGQPIELADLRRLLNEQASVCKTFQLTPFEQLLASALVHFHRENVDLLVLEVGLGGRLDATTAHPKRPLIAMASIGLDHCEHLGSTLTAIATEKAAVITPESCVVSAEQHPDVRAVLEDSCHKQGAELRWVSPLDDSWNLGLPGQLQRRNAAVARGVLQALGALGWSLNDDDLRGGFARARWNGRMQRVRWRNEPLLMDGAHNPPAAEQLHLERRHWPGEEAGVNWILGIQAHKQAIAMLQILLQPQDRAWIVPVPDHNSWTLEALLQRSPQWTDQLISASSVEQALVQINTPEQRKSAVPVLAGSLYLIGDLLARAVVTAE